MPEPDTSNTDRKKRRRRKKKQQTQNDNDTGSQPTQDKANSPGSKSKKKSKRRPLRTEVNFGLFHCKKCDRKWESAHVYTIAGTDKVLWRQRCKRCTGDDAWVFPFYHEPITCRECLKRPCICTCEDCGKLKRRPPKTKGTDLPQDPSQSQVEYCQCKKKKQALGGLIDPKKPHLRELCERCRQGKLCGVVHEHAECDGETGNEP